MVCAILAGLTVIGFQNAEPKMPKWLGEEESGEQKRGRERGRASGQQRDLMEAVGAILVGRAKERV